MRITRDIIDRGDWGAIYDLALKNLVTANRNRFQVDLTYAYDHPEIYNSHEWKIYFKSNVAYEIRQKFIKNVEQIVAVMKVQDNPPGSIVPDRHRISAALLIAVLQAAPFTSEPPEKSRLPLALRLPNEAMGLRLAEDFLISQIMNTAARKGLTGTAIFNYLEERRNLIEPNLGSNNGKPVAYLVGTGTYKKHLIYALNHAHGEGTLNVFFLAHILFWLEWNTLEMFSQDIKVPSS